MSYDATITDLLGGSTPDEVIAADRNRSLIPAGWYNVVVSAVDPFARQARNAADGVVDTGYDIKFQITTRGEFMGKIVVLKHFTAGGGEVQRSISRGVIARIAKALGPNLGPSVSSLKGRHLQIKITLSKPNQTGAQYNNVNDALPLGAAAPVAKGAAPSWTPPAAPAPASAAPAPAMAAPAPAMAGSTDSKISAGGSTAPWRAR